MSPTAAVPMRRESWSAVAHRQRESALTNWLRVTAVITTSPREAAIWGLGVVPQKSLANGDQERTSRQTSIALEGSSERQA